MVSPSASSEDLADVSNFFRVCPTNREQAQMAADFLLKKKQKIEIAILYDSTTSYAITLKNDIAGDNGYIPKVNIVGPVSYVGGDSKTLQDALNTLLAQSPDAIFFAGQVTDLAVLLNAISSIPQAKNLLIVGGDTFAITNAYPNPLPDLHNVYFTAFASPNEWDGTNQTPPFFRDYQSNFGTPPASTGLPSVDADVMLGYDATFTLLYASQQVLSKQNTIAPSDVTQALKQIKGTNAIQGVTGRIAFKDNGDQQSKRVILEHIEGTSLKVYDSQGCFRVTDNCGP